MNKGKIISSIINVILAITIDYLFGNKAMIIYFVGVLLGGIECIIGGYNE